MISTSPIALPFTSSHIERILESIMHLAPDLVGINSTWLILISSSNALFWGEFMPSLYLKQLYSIAVNLLTLEVFEETPKDFKELHGSIYAITRQM